MHTKRYGTSSTFGPMAYSPSPNSIRRFRKDVHASYGAAPRRAAESLSEHTDMAGKGMHKIKQERQSL